VLGWLVKLVATLGLAGVLAFDGLSIATTAVSLQDQAANAARSGSDAVERTPTAQAAYDAALASAVDAHALNEIDPTEVAVASTGAVTVTLHRTAPTLVVQRIQWFSDWVERSSTASAAPIR